LLKYCVKTRIKIPVHQDQIVALISNPTVFSFPMESSIGEMNDLLQLFKNKKIVEPNKEILLKYHIPYDVVVNKLKLLYLSTFECIDFEQVKKECSVENVESFVMKGIAGGLHFKVDQIGQKVYCAQNGNLIKNIHSIKQSIEKL
jgi:hypothetical protein